MITFFDYLKLIAEEAVAQAPNPAVAGAAGAPKPAAFPQQFTMAAADPTNKGFSANANMSQANMQGQDMQQNKQKLQDILGKDYTTFVQMLGQNINDPKFLKFLQMGLEDGAKQDDVVKFQQMQIPCAQLIPTQNEIDMGQSLAYPLQKTPTAKLMQYFAAVPQAPGGPIITCCGGKFIIDGHHRWSQLFCMNPQCPISAIDMSGIGSPEMALKIAQLGTVAQGTYRQAKVKPGNNLITVGKQALEQFVDNTMEQQAYDAFAQLQQQMSANQNRQEAMDPNDPVVQFANNYLWKNVQQMQQNNAPIAGAPKRDFMPQTGDSAAGFMRHLAAGKVNWNTQA